MTAPRFGEDTLADETVVPGLANHLTPFVGDAKSFFGPSNRYLRFIGSGLNIGRTFLHSWDVMRAEVGDALGSIFEALAKDAPGRPPPEDEDPRPEGKPGLQRLCTHARQRVRRGFVKTLMALLDLTNPLRQAP